MALQPIINPFQLRAVLDRTWDSHVLLPILTNIVINTDKALVEWREGHQYDKYTDLLFRDIISSLEKLQVEVHRRIPE